MQPDPQRGPLLVLDRYAGPQAGTERQILELASGLIKRGLRPGFVLLERSLWLEARFPDAPFFVVGSARLRSAAFWRQANRAPAWARAQGFQVAHIFLNDCALVFPALLRSRGIRVVQARRDLGFWYTPFKLRWLRLNRRWTDAVVANSVAVAETIAAAEGYERSRIKVIYNGLHPAAGSDADRDAVRASLRLGPDDRLVVFVANLRSLKRPDDAIRAVAALPHIGSGSVHLALVGADPSPVGARVRSLQALAGELSASGRVHFPGRVADAMPWLAAADACLLCSETEGLSNAVIEYMLAGRPAVCTAVGGNPELITDGETGFLVGVGDVGSITDRLRRVLEDPAEGRRIGEAARRSALERFTVDAMVSQYAELYELLKAAG